MNRKKTKIKIKELKKDLKAANRASRVRLFKLAFVIVILAIAAVFIYPNPLRGKLRHWIRESFSSFISASPHPAEQK
jgi:hypothetical protein